MVILTIFKFSSYILSIKQTRVRTIFSRDSTSNKSLVSIDLIVLMRLLIKTFSSSLFLTIIHFLVWICSLTIKIVIVSRAWSKMKCYSSWIEWLFSSSDPNCRNIKLRIKFKSWLLSEYLVGTWLMGLDRPKLKNSAMSNNKLLWEEWCGYTESYKLSLILKSPVITKIFWISTSTFLKYFKTAWNESK